MAGGQFKSLIGSIKRKPTSAPDRRTDAEANGTNGEKTSLTHDLGHMKFGDLKMLAEALPSLATGAPLDDKELLLEHGVSMLQGLPLNSGLSSTVSDGFIKMLWNDLPHPPATLAGPTSRYRRHDGGGNNPWNPEMGKAGSPYSRSVPPSKPKGPNLPDVELVYEQLMKRVGPFREHPSGLNRMFFSFATVVIHECFQTSRKDQWINETSSYVDLSTLYGNTEEEQKRVRTYQNGSIYPDSIASERIMLMPPGVVAVLVMFSRNHNSIVKSLMQVNEEGKYRPWDTLNEEQKHWQDEDLFQLARNINVGFFATVVLKDYVAAILNTPRANSYWSLDLGKEIKSGGGRVERGGGNVVSVEFAVLYHWHAALSAADAQWMEDLIRWNLPELKDIEDMTLEMFQKVVMMEGHKLMNTPPKEWTFNNLKRGEDGSFNDAELAEIIKSCIEEPAHAFGAHGTPQSLKIVDIMGQLQARNLFNVCTMNEFRKYLNLQPYKTFEDWNPDKVTARAAELLYGHIDNLELYPGLMAECTKPPMPGSGVCPGQTTGRGILDDAVALVRGDRFLSYDFNSSTLTNWGVSKLGGVPPGSYGGMLPHLIFTALPAGFTGTSNYALIPFYTPKAAKEILTNNKVAQLYDFQRPANDHSLVSVQTQAGCTQVYGDVATFRIPTSSAVRNTTGGHDSLFVEEGFESKVIQFFSANAADLIKSCSLKYPGARRSVDVVRDVTNIAPVLWLAQRFAIPLKTEKTPHGILSLPQVFEMWLAIYLYQNLNILPVNEWKLREGATKASEILGKILSAHLKTQQGIKEHIVDFLAKGSSFEVGPDADRLFHALNATKQPVADSVADCLTMGAPVAGILSHQGSRLIDLFLSPGYEQYKERIIELSQSNSPESLKELQGFVYEGIRHASVVPGVARVATKDVTVQDGTRGPVAIKANQTVLIATSNAAMDPIAFPDPEKLDPHRPTEAYAVLGYGLHSGYGQRLIAPALAATLKEVFKLKNVRRAAGRLGRFSIIGQEIAGGVKIGSYLDSNSAEQPIPTTLTIEYDE